MVKNKSVNGKVAEKNSEVTKKSCKNSTVLKNSTSPKAKPSKSKTLKKKDDEKRELSSHGNVSSCSSLQTANRKNSKCSKDSSSDASILDNPTDSTLKTGRSRKCKVETPSKSSNVLKKTKKPPLRRISESSCGSVHKQALEESNNAENVPVESTNRSLTKESGSTMGGDKYSELFSIFKSNEEDLKDFIKQYKIWQQSKTDPSPPAKKKTRTKTPSTLKKPVKSRVVRNTPKAELAKPNLNKLKDKVTKKRTVLEKGTKRDGKTVSGKAAVDGSSNKAGCDVIRNENLIEKTNRPSSYETECNSPAIDMEIINETSCNDEVEDRLSVAEIYKSVSEEKGSDSVGLNTDNLNKTGEVDAEEISSDKKKLNAIPEETDKISVENVDKSEIELDNIVSDKSDSEAAANLECENDSINSSPKTSEHIENNLFLQHSIEKKGINHLEDSINESVKSDSESSSELIDEKDYDGVITNEISGVRDSRPIETEKCLESVSFESNNNIYEQEEIIVDEQDNFQNINYRVNSSDIDEKEFESEGVWKRKGSPNIYDTAVCAKKIKKSLNLKEKKINDMPDSSFDHCHDELIYSDEDKTSHLTKSRNVSEIATDYSDLVNTEGTNCYAESCNLSRYEEREGLLDIHKRKQVKDTDSNDTDCDMNPDHTMSPFEDKKDKSLEICIDSIDLETPRSSSQNKRKHKKNERPKTKTAKVKKQKKKPEKVSKTRAKSKIMSKNIEQKIRLQNSFSICQNNNEESSNNKQTSEDIISNEVNKLINKPRSKNAKEDNEHKSILESDMPVVEVTYKGEKLHGIHVNEYNVEYLKMNKPKQSLWDQENPLKSSHTEDVLMRFLRPICSKVLRNGFCKDHWSCKKQHTVPREFFNDMNKHDAWLIISFVLHISDNICKSFIEAVLEFLGNQKAKKKVLLISEHILKSKQNELSYQKSCWEMIFKALECCGLHRWEAIKTVIRFILDRFPSIKTVVIHHLLKIWCVHSPAISNTWSIVEPLVTEKKINLPPLILSKLVGEIITAELNDKKTVYHLVVKQLTSLPKERFSQINYRLLNDFLRKLAQEGLHNEERALRDRAKVTYQFGSQLSPTHSSSHHPTNTSNLSRSKSMINLANIGSNNDFYTHTKVHEEEKMEAAVYRALQCSNYDSVVTVIANCSKQNFISKILLAVYNHIKETCAFSGLKAMLTKHKEKYSTSNPDVKELIGNIVLSVMLDKVKQYNWTEANSYLSLLEDNNINKYKSKPLVDPGLRPVRLAITCSEIYYYNGKYKDAIGILINTNVLHPKSTEWLVSGGTKDDYRVINVMVLFLMSKLLSKGIIDVGTMLFKAVLELQPNLSEPIDIGQYFEILLYKLFERTREYPETAIKLFQRVSAKERNLSLYGLTYRALIILAYRTHRRQMIKELFYKAIEEYAYPIIEEKENVIMLLKSYTEEEIIVYIMEWLASFKEKLSNIDCSDGEHQILIKFKEAVLEDFLDDQVLGIPAILKDIDQTLPGAIKRLESVLKQLPIRFKQIKKDTLSIEPTTFQNFLRKIKVSRYDV